MAWTKYQLSLALMMVVTGSINTLSTKWADSLEAEGRDGKLRHFQHPFLQACCMFFGELMCLVLFKIMYFIYSKRNDGTEDVSTLTKGNRTFNPFILFIPAMCDMLATSTMYVGLNLTYASSFQMFRGAVIIFVGLLSVGFLNRVLKTREWSGIIFVIFGLTMVGLADFFNQNDTGDGPSRNNIITGDLLILTAQIITAVQMVVEEKFVAGLDIPPLQAVGWEGFFGFIVLGCLQVPFYFIKVGPPFTDNSRGVLEDAIEAFVQMGNNFRLPLAILGNVVSIAFFNFAGISVTKELSATTRMVLDSIRTIVIWIVSLSFMGQKFHYLQLIGFFGLICGMCLYNNITCRNTFLKIRSLCASVGYRRMESEVIENRTATLPDDDNTQ